MRSRTGDVHNGKRDMIEEAELGDAVPVTNEHEMGTQTNEGPVPGAGEANQAVMEKDPGEIMEAAQAVGEAEQVIGYNPNDFYNLSDLGNLVDDGLGHNWFLESNNSAELKSAEMDAELRGEIEAEICKKEGDLFKPSGRNPELWFPTAFISTGIRMVDPTAPSHSLLVLPTIQI